MLRGYQQATLGGIEDRIEQGYRNICVSLPRCSGSTHLAGYMAQGTAAQGGRVLATVPNKGMVQVTADAFAGACDVGMIQSELDACPDAPIQVASLCSLDTHVPPAKLVVFDHAHTQLNRIQDVMAKLPNALFIGFTAMPYKKDMQKIWDTLVSAANIAELRAEGVIAHYDLYAPFTPVRPETNRFKEFQASYVTDERVFYAATESYKSFANDELALVYCINIPHAKAVADACNKAGIKSVSITAESCVHEYEAARSDPDVKVVATVNTMARGQNMGFSCIIDAAPTMSKIIFAERYGSGLGGKKLVYVDLCGNIEHFGTPEGPTATLGDNDSDSDSDSDSDNVFIYVPFWCNKCGASSETSKCPRCGNVFCAPKKPKTVENLAPPIELEPEPVSQMGLQLHSSSRPKPSPRRFDHHIAVGTKFGDSCQIWHFTQWDHSAGAQPAPFSSGPKFPEAVYVKVSGYTYFVKQVEDQSTFEEQFLAWAEGKTDQEIKEALDAYAVLKEAPE